METLEIKNFLIINNASFDVKKINIIIGCQASGKSIVSKILYFFKNFLNSTFLKSVENFDGKRDLQKDALKEFSSFFPKYTWSSQEFKLSYSFHEIEVSIENILLPSGRYSLKFTYNDFLSDLRLKLKKSYQKFLDELDDNERSRFLPGSSFWRFSRENIQKDDNLSHLFPDVIFIPASRSFFANLQNNVFSFLASNIDIDPFLRDFGSRYENAKRLYDESFLTRKSGETNKKLADQIVEKILVGKYEYLDEKDWITDRGRKVNLSNASSGQQEALPMLLILSSFPYFMDAVTFFIEEPEAHLFPTAQKEISLLLSLLQKLGHSFVITTHSPYILTGLNNMILANDVRKTNQTKEFKKKFNPVFDLSFDEVSASTIENGKLINILDYKNNLIGASVIDKVSDVFEREFDEILGFIEG